MVGSWKRFLQISVLLSCWICIPCAARLNMRGHTSYFRVASAAELVVDQPVADFSGKLVRDAGGTVSGSAIDFVRGIFEDDGNNLLLNAILDLPNNEVALDGNRLLRAEPGKVLQGINVSSTGNRIEGQPLLASAQEIVLESASELTLAIQTPLTENVQLNDGIVILDSDLAFADYKRFIGPGTINVNNKSISWGGRPLTFAETIVWENATDQQYWNKVDITSTQPVNNDTNNNFNGNILEFGPNGQYEIGKTRDISLQLTDVLIKGVVSSTFDFFSTASDLILIDADVAFKEDTEFSVGDVYVGTPSTWILYDKNVNFSGDATLTVDGVTLCKDYAGAATHGDLTFSAPSNLNLINNGTIVDCYGAAGDVTALDYLYSCCEKSLSCCEVNSSAIEELYSCCDLSLSCCDLNSTAIEELYTCCEKSLSCCEESLSCCDLSLSCCELHATAIEELYSCCDLSLSCCDLNSTAIEELYTCCEKSLSCCEESLSCCDLSLSCCELHATAIEELYSCCDLSLSCCDLNSTAIEELYTCCEKSLSCCENNSTAIEELYSCCDLSLSCCELHATAIEELYSCCDLSLSCCDLNSTAIEELYTCCEKSLSCCEESLSCCDLSLSCCELHATAIEELYSCCDLSLSCCDLNSTAIEELYTCCEKSLSCCEESLSCCDLSLSCCELHATAIEELYSCCDLNLSCCETNSTAIEDLYSCCEKSLSCCELHATAIEELYSCCEDSLSCCETNSSAIEQLYSCCEDSITCCEISLSCCEKSLSCCEEIDDLYSCCEKNLSCCEENRSLIDYIFESCCDGNATCCEFLQSEIDQLKECLDCECTIKISGDMIFDPATMLPKEGETKILRFTACFDGCVHEPTLTIYADRYELPKNSRLLFSGQGTVEVLDGVIFELEGTPFDDTKDDWPALITENLATLHINENAQVIVAGAGCFVVRDHGTLLMDQENSWLYFGESPLNDIDCVTDFGSNWSIDHIDAHVAFRWGTFEIIFKNHSILHLWQGIFELNTVNGDLPVYYGMPQAGIISKFHIIDGSDLDIRKVGGLSALMTMAPNYGDLPVDLDTRSGFIRAGGDLQGRSGGDLQFKRFDTDGTTVLVDTTLQIQSKNIAIIDPMVTCFKELTYVLLDRVVVESPDVVILALLGTRPDQSQAGRLAAFLPEAFEQGLIVPLAQGDHDVFYDRSVAGGLFDLVRGADQLGRWFTISNGDAATRTHLLHKKRVRYYE